MFLKKMKLSLDSRVQTFTSIVIWVFNSFSLLRNRDPFLGLKNAFAIKTSTRKSFQWTESVGKSVKPTKPGTGGPYYGRLTHLPRMSVSFIRGTLLASISVGKGGPLMLD